jgi:GPH family glycoside/pentoside/hexuronide:cation symporter
MNETHLKAWLPRMAGNPTVSPPSDNSTLGLIRSLYRPLLRSALRWPMASAGRCATIRYVSAPEPPPTLPKSLLVFYGLPMSAYLLMTLPVAMWLMKFATDTLLIAPAAIGGIYAAARIWDAISDPMVGYLSDRTRSSLGRRRSWIFASVIPLGATYVMLWSPPASLDPLMVIGWIAAALILWETASTAFYIPYNALGLEITTDYHERTRLFAWRQMIVTLGFGGALGFIYLMRTAGDQRAMAFEVSLYVGILVAVVIALCAWRTPESKSHQGRGGEGLLASFRDVAQNPHARLLFFIFGIESLGMGIVSTLSAFIMDDLIGRIDLIEALLATWMIPQFLFVPLWIRYSRRFGKKRLWLFGMACVSLGFAGQFFLTAGDWQLVFGCVLLIGTGTSVSQVIGPSIQADVVDWDELQSGQRKEGAYAAVWNFIRKAGSAGAAGLGGLALSLGGYDPAADVQTEQVKDAIRSTAGIFPAVTFLIGMAAFSRFSLNEAEHAEVLEQIRVRNAD